MVGLSGSAADLCSSAVTLTNSRTGAGSDASGFYALGTSGVTFTATDASGNSASCASSVKVRDTMAPSLNVTLSPSILWPPNHRMVPIHVSWQASDVCDPALEVVLASVTCNEPDDEPGSGDGDSVGDIQDASIGTPDPTVLLRAERSGKGHGRVYTLTYIARDDSGNSASSPVIVTVPSD